MSRLTTSAVFGAALIGLVACGSGDPSLMNIRNDEAGPDEFAVLPTRPLQMPDNLRSLPTPTPGATSRADPNPEADAIAALGGNASRGSQAGDVISYAGRFGVSPDIRSTLASEDLAFRSRNDGRILERMFGTPVYFDAYSRQSLDQYAELERLRRSGIRTPAAPPPAE